MKEKPKIKAPKGKIVSTEKLLKPRPPKNKVARNEVIGRKQK